MGATCSELDDDGDRGSGAPILTTDLSGTTGTGSSLVGWHIQDQEGNPQAGQLKCPLVRLWDTRTCEPTTAQGVLQGELHLRGAISALGGDLLMSEWIDAAFAVVKTDAAGVTALSEKLPVGQTDSPGLLLIPDVRAHQQNKIELDPRDLPADAALIDPVRLAVPRDEGGVLVDLTVKQLSDAALVSFTLPDKTPIPPGARGQLEGRAEFIVGYDGQSVVEGLGAQNRYAIDLGYGI